MADEHMTVKTEGGESNSIVAIVAIVILAGLAALFLFYVLPEMQKRAMEEPEQRAIQIDIQNPVEPPPPPAPAPNPPPRY